MKKLFLIGVISLVNYAVFGQTIAEKKTVSTKQFEISITPKLGFAKINETGNAPLNGFVNGADALISMGISKKLSLSSGLSYFEFDGNRTVFGNSSSLKNAYFQIPLRMNGDLDLSTNNSNTVCLSYGFGIYGSTLLQQRIETYDEKSSKNNLGWNLGFSSQLGLKFKLSDTVNVGIGYESQGDWFKMKKNNIERKIDNMNAIYFRLGYKL
jgi:opacity protein-like surface antigen